MALFKRHAGWVEWSSVLRGVQEDFRIFGVVAEIVGEWMGLKGGEWMGLKGGGWYGDGESKTAAWQDDDFWRDDHRLNGVIVDS